MLSSLVVVPDVLVARSDRRCFRHWELSLVLLLLGAVDVSLVARNGRRCSNRCERS